jgi:hypothetical protein
MMAATPARGDAAGVESAVPPSELLASRPPPGDAAKSVSRGKAEDARNCRPNLRGYPSGKTQPIRFRVPSQALIASHGSPCEDRNYEHQEFAGRPAPPR